MDFFIMKEEEADFQTNQNNLVRDATQKKIRDFLGIFPKEGGGVFSIPKTFAN